MGSIIAWIFFVGLGLFVTVMGTLLIYKILSGILMPHLITFFVHRQLGYFFIRFLDMPDMSKESFDTGMLNYTYGKVIPTKEMYNAGNANYALSSKAARNHKDPHVRQACAMLEEITKMMVYRFRMSKQDAIGQKLRKRQDFEYRISFHPKYMSYQKANMVSLHEYIHTHVDDSKLLRKVLQMKNKRGR